MRGLRQHTKTVAAVGSRPQRHAVARPPLARRERAGERNNNPRARLCAAQRRACSPNWVWPSDPLDIWCATYRSKTAFRRVDDARVPETLRRLNSVFLDRQAGFYAVVEQLAKDDRREALVKRAWPRRFPSTPRQISPSQERAQTQRIGGANEGVNALPTIVRHQDAATAILSTEDNGFLSGGRISDMTRLCTH
jgi:hypothetical protein